MVDAESMKKYCGSILTGIQSNLNLEWDVSPTSTSNIPKVAYRYCKMCP